MQLRAALLLLTLALTAASYTVAAAKFEFKFDSSSSAQPVRPHDALFACCKSPLPLSSFALFLVSDRVAFLVFVTAAIKSKTCKSPTRFLRPSYPMNVHLEACHSDGLLRSYFNRFLPILGKGGYVSTFYGACKEGDGKCQDWVKRKSMGELAEEIRRNLEEETDCEPKVSCYHLDEVDGECRWKRE